MINRLVSTPLHFVSFIERNSFLNQENFDWSIKISPELCIVHETIHIRKILFSDKGMLLTWHYFLITDWNFFFSSFIK